MDLPEHQFLRRMRRKTMHRPMYLEMNCIAIVLQMESGTKMYWDLIRIKCLLIGIRMCEEWLHSKKHMQKRKKRQLQIRKSQKFFTNIWMLQRFLWQVFREKMENG